MRRCVWSRNLMNEEAMARVGPQRHKKYKKKVLWMMMMMMMIVI